MCRCGWRAEGGGPNRCFFTHVCCCTLKTTAYVVAVLDMVVFLVATFALLVPWAIFLSEAKGTDVKRGNIGGIVRISSLSLGLRFGAHFIVSCLLMHGLRTKRRELLWGYVCARFLLMAALVSFWIQTLLFIPRMHLSAELIAIVTSVMLGILGIIIFNTLIVRTYAIQLKAMAALSDTSLYYSREEERVLHT